MNGHRDVLVPVLEQAQRLGFLGPGPVEPHLAHAAGFAEALRGRAGSAWSPTRAADLGTGAGIPGLALATLLADTEWVLVDSSVRRTAFVRVAVHELGLSDRVTVVEDRAEAVGRSPAYRSGFDLVVARSFGPPAVVTECAAPLLVVGGWAVISEPPGGDPGRWPAEGLALLGMVPAPAGTAGGATYQVLRQERACTDRFPRRVGVPAKRPLF